MISLAPRPAVRAERVSDDRVAGAYDAIAGRYDQTMKGDDWVRSLLWRRFDRLFSPGQRILDVSCGTGTDALYLASRGIRVTGIDISAGMVATLRDRVAAAGLTSMIDARVMDLADLEACPDARYDAIISTFAGLNTVNDLAQFAVQARRSLKPGGVLLVHMLNRFSLWEWLRLMSRGHVFPARRLASRRTRTFVIGGQSVPHRLYAPIEAHQTFVTHGFTMLRVYGMGAVRPPATVRGIPTSVLRVLERLDDRVGRYRPWRDWGRFFVLELTLASDCMGNNRLAAAGSER